MYQKWYSKSMLKHIPFYASLLGKDLTESVKSSNRHVLLYGAVEVHHEGKIGCRASNKTLAAECGLSDVKISQYLLEMKKGGWIDYTLSAENRRGAIVPLLEIFVPSHKNSDTLSQKMSTPLTKIVAIDNIIDNIKEFSFNKEKEKLSSSNKPSKILLFYINYKNIEIRTSTEWKKFTKTFYPAAAALDGYSRDEIETSFHYADEHYKTWTLHAIAKNISTILATL